MDIPIHQYLDRAYWQHRELDGRKTRDGLLKLVGCNYTGEEKEAGILTLSTLCIILFISPFGMLDLDYLEREEGREAVENFKMNYEVCWCMNYVHGCFSQMMLSYLIRPKEV